MTTTRKRREIRLEVRGERESAQEFVKAWKQAYNLEIEIPGASRRDEIVLVGAHYVSVVGSPGADDNASGAAALLALAKSPALQKPGRTLRFVAFANEEPPHFQTE